MCSNDKRQVKETSRGQITALHGVLKNLEGKADFEDSHFRFSVENETEIRRKWKQNQFNYFNGSSKRCYRPELRHQSWAWEAWKDIEITGLWIIKKFKCSCKCLFVDLSLKFFEFFVFYFVVAVIVCLIAYCGQNSKECEVWPHISSQFPII